MEKKEIAKRRVTVMLKSLIVSFLITFIMLLILALLLYKVNLKESFISAGIAATYVLSCFFGGFLSGKKLEEKKFLWGLCIGLSYFLLLFGASMILAPGAMADAAYIGSATALCLSGGMLGGMVA